MASRPVYTLKSQQILFPKDSVALELPLSSLVLSNSILCRVFIIEIVGYNKGRAFSFMRLRYLGGFHTWGNKMTWNTSLSLNMLLLLCYVCAFVCVLTHIYTCACVALKWKNNLWKTVCFFHHWLPWMELELLNLVVYAFTLPFHWPCVGLGLVTACVEEDKGPGYPYIGCFL